MVRVFSIYVPNKACAVYCTRYKHLTIIRRTQGDYQGILYLKFKLSNEKTAFVPRDNVIFLPYFTQIHDFAIQRGIL
jgi:hypothetical protein